MKDFLISGFVIISILAVLIIPIFVGMQYLENLRCTARWENSGLQSKYSWSSGCLVTQDGRIWIPSANYREIAD